MDRIAQDNKGTSLVEVIVVMVVLLVGIMSVVMMFPSGFGVVKAAESRTIATRLGQQELERWKMMSDGLPNAFIPIMENGAFFADNTGYSNEIRNRCVMAGPPFATFMEVENVLQRGNVLNIRQVLGETTHIPAPGYFQTGNGTAFGSKYTLAFSPIDAYWNGSEYDGLEVKSADLQRIESRDGSIRTIKLGQYQICYNSDGPSFYVAFPRESSDIGRFYYISYSYWADDGANPPILLTKLNQRVPALSSNPTDSLTYIEGSNTDWVEVPLPTVGSYSPIEIEPETDTCARGFWPLREDELWSSDPYEFKLTDSILGVVAFNPNAQSFYEYTASGKEPIKARIDYRIYDPRILREDRVIPSAAAINTTEIPIKLALRFILDAGEPGNIHDGDPTDNPDEPTFEGLMRGSGGVPQLGTEITNAGDLIIPYSILIVDLKTGLRVAAEDKDSGAVIIIDGPDYVDFKTGTVYLPGPGAKYPACLIDYNNDIIVSDVDLQGRNLRFFYRADGDWSVQCRKAYSKYSRVYDSATVDYRHFCLTTGSNTSGQNVWRLLFAPCDAGKTVSVDYTYAESADASEQRVVGRACQISDYDDGAGYYFVDLDVLATCDIRRVSVTGTSFTARVIWRDGEHWRYVDMGTGLTRGGG